MVVGATVSAGFSSVAFACVLVLSLYDIQTSYALYRDGLSHNDGKR